ncbi:MAG: pyridoxal phosphate-dependent aminotransferase family protein, partial [Thermoguttaceae bacterium]|nr:pyridoxal phosphate-dependent aminotransferase family protein [Thermoguttaceae bacterium]
MTARFSRVREFVVFKHCNPEDLREKLQNELALGERPLLLTDGVFSNFGTVAPLKAYEKILQNFGDSAMLIDDSHGIGVLGETGRGT